MANRISDRLQAALHENRIGVMPYLTAGFPTVESTAELIRICNNAGSTAIEIGFPFSDPIADGPVISAAMQHSLANGTTPEQILDAVRSVRADTEAGLVAMVSQSIVHRFGGPAWFEQLKGAGFDGLIIPDLDLDEADDLQGRAAELDMTFSLLIAPTVSPGFAADSSIYLRAPG